jgi:putative hemolysin
MDFLILCLLIVLNGVFALSEMAIVSARKPRLKAMADGGSRNAQLVLRMLEDPSKLLSTTQVGITLIGVLSGAYGATALADDLAPVLANLSPSMEKYAGATAFGIVIVITTVLSLIIGELVPKRIALAAPEKLAVLTAPLMRFLETIASPVIMLLRFATENIVRLLGLHRGSSDDVTEEELQSLIEEGARVGVIDEDERDMIGGVMRLADRSVRGIMTPRIDVVWLDPSASREELLEEIKSSGHSRYPVALGDLNELEGVVQTKDLFSYLAETGSVSLKAVMHKPVFVPETVQVIRVLEAMHSNPVRMVFVTDEYGSILGLVTAADILEAIAGDVALGKDEGLDKPVQREDGSWLIDGGTPIDELPEIVGVRSLGDAEGYSTLAGMIMHLMRTVPSAGDKVEQYPLSFEVLDMDGRRIDKVLVRRMEPPIDDPSG